MTAWKKLEDMPDRMKDGRVILLKSYYGPYDITRYFLVKWEGRGFQEVPAGEDVEITAWRNWSWTEVPK